MKDGVGVSMSCYTLYSGLAKKITCGVIGYKDMVAFFEDISGCGD